MSSLPPSLSHGSPRLMVGHSPGSGPLLVYLHGLGCAGNRDWPPVARSTALQGRASLWVDLAGFGQSERPADFSYDLSAQAELLAELLGSESGPIVQVGHSMGGTLAVLLAERLLRDGRPLHALVLAEPNLRPEDATGSARAAATPVETFLRGWDDLVRGTSSGWYQENLRQADPLAFHRSAVSLVHHGANMLARFAALPLERKGYVLGGRSDSDTHETARRVAAAGIPVVTVKDSGHAFSEDDPEGFGRAILQLI
ncbi:alpha/beta fold hydrolase [Vitiosangium sp. GDMCC 1.1324]|uniref:alpha/beta fold hydrolase n=1 Tax=Vitiosangium sp. (strain GDMCC 1.1324) TaxID=2138576 RepID=UPI000D37D8F2|nr:alpha/beta hydrolase [Vitiosangium sp. GDMCC 1.1324]PTL83950.1 alpha/beta hydrolase [Vitiosangium sp. GDMCC 1.1324]